MCTRALREGFPSFPFSSSNQHPLWMHSKHTSTLILPNAFNKASLLKWRLGRDREICMPLKDKRRAPFHLKGKNLRNLSMLMESNDCSDSFFPPSFLLVKVWNILTEVDKWKTGYCIDLICGGLCFWLTSSVRLGPLISFSFAELHDTDSRNTTPVYRLCCVNRGVWRSLALCCFTKDPFMMPFWLPIVCRRRLGKVKLSLSQLESCWGRRGLRAHWHN